MVQVRLAATTNHPELPPFQTFSPSSMPTGWPGLGASPPAATVPQKIPLRYSLPSGVVTGWPGPQGGAPWYPYPAQCVPVMPPVAVTVTLSPFVTLRVAVPGGATSANTLSVVVVEACAAGAASRPSVRASAPNPASLVSIFICNLLYRGYGAALMLVSCVPA